jgi:hypothetical protein
MSKINEPSTHFPLAQGLAAVAGRLEPKEAAQVAAMLTQAMTKTDQSYVVQQLAQPLSAALGGDQRRQGVQAVAAAVGSLHNGQGLATALALLRPAAEPYRGLLSDQELVELLKLPLCVGPARRAVLDQLGWQHQRTFADQWEFVRYAEERKLGLDFTSPPRRP